MAIIEKKGSLYFKDSTGKERSIGTIKEDTLNIYRNKKLHLHRNMNGYGLNKEIVDSGLFKFLTLLEEDNGDSQLYILPIEDINMFPVYKASDFEVQFMLTLDRLKQYKI